MKSRKVNKAEDPVRVLVVDDDAALRMLTREALESAGFHVEEAADGVAGLRAFRTTCPNLVLLDVMMPRMNGFEVCSAIRDIPEGIDVPVLIMTSLEDMDTIELAYEAGATDFIAKPINWALLSHRARFMIQASRAFRALRETEGQLSGVQQTTKLGNRGHG